MAVSTMKAEFPYKLEKVWEIVTSLEKFSWRCNLDKIVVTVPENEFEEHHVVKEEKLRKAVYRYGN